MDLGKLAELSEHRKCLVCNEEFFTDKETTALAKFSDHSVIHNPDGSQWGTAHHRIQVGKETGKPCDCDKCKEKGLA